MGDRPGAGRRGPGLRSGAERVSFADPANSGASRFGIGEVFWFAVGMLALGAVLAVVVKFAAPDYSSGRTMRADFAQAAASSDPSIDPAGESSGACGQA